MRSVSAYQTVCGTFTSFAANGRSIVDATLARHVTDVDVTGVRSHRLPRDRQPKTEARTIGAASMPEGLKQIAFLLLNTAAFVLYFDEHTSRVRMCAKRSPSPLRTCT
jgi:hypothetical protein